MGKTKTKKKQQKLNPARLILTGIVVVLLIVFLLSVKNIWDLKREQAELNETNTALKEQKTELETELKNVNDSNYIEEQARTQLNMVKPGEILYILDKEGKKDKMDEE